MYPKYEEIEIKGVFLELFKTLLRLFKIHMMCKIKSVEFTTIVLSTCVAATS